MNMTVYQTHGYRSRMDYLQSLANDFGVDLETVITLSDFLGHDEDFDLLVITLEGML